MTSRQALLDAVKPYVPLRYRRAIKLARLAARERTHELRAMPDFVVVGAMRAGTSSLFKYLSQHPQIFPSLRKETEFFSMEYGRGLGWYRSHFPTRMRLNLERLRGRPGLSFEATPYYLFHPRAADRAAECVPNAKIIAMLREPTERAHSHYKHMVRHGIETLGFEDALACEAERIEGEEDRMCADPTYTSLAHHRFSYVSRGIYAPQLERWIRAFSREQVLIVRSEDMYERPAEAFSRIVRFLGLPDWQPSEFRNYSYLSRDEAKAVRTDEIDPTLRQRLDETFAPHNDALFRMLGCEPLWRRDD